MSSLNPDVQRTDVGGGHRADGTVGGAGTAPSAAPGASAPAATGHPNPYRGVPASDHVRDVVAAVLLLSCLALPWDVAHRGSDRVGVVLVVLLSLASLALPHLARAGVFPSGWTVLTTRRVRLLAGAPFVLLVVFHLVLQVVLAVGSTTDRLTLLSAGLGAAAAAGLAGAVLAAQPRRSETGPQDQDRTVGRTWLLVTAALAAAAVLVALGTLVLGLLYGVAVLGSPPLALANRVLTAVVVVVVLAPLAGVVARDARWRVVAVAVGASTVAAQVLVGLTTSGGVESILSATTALLLLPAACAAASAPATARVMGPAGLDDAQGWLVAARRTLVVLAALAGAEVLATVSQLVGSPATGTLVAVVLLLALVGAGALVARAALVRSGPAGVRTAVAAGGAVLVVGLVALVVIGASDQVGAGTDVLVVLVALPLAVLCVLMVPAPVRRAAAAVGSDDDGQPSWAAAYTWQAPAAKGPRPDAATRRQARERARAARRSAVAAAPGDAPGAGVPGGDGATVTGGDEQPVAPAGTTAASTGEDADHRSRPEPAEREQALDGRTGPEEAGRERTQDARAQHTGPGAGDLGATAVVAPVPVEGGQGADRVEQVVPADQAETTVVEVHDPRAERSHRGGDGAEGGDGAGEPVAGQDDHDHQGPTGTGEGFSAAQAADPGTDPAVLAEICARAPHLHAEVASNPSAYPALLEWLAALGDPAVDAALARRR